MNDYFLKILIRQRDEEMSEAFRGIRISRLKRRRSSHGTKDKAYELEKKWFCRAARGQKYRDGDGKIRR